MNINYNTILKNIIPIILIFFIAYIVMTFTEFLLPKKGIEQTKTQDFSLKYYNYRAACKFHHHKLVNL